MTLPSIWCSEAGKIAAAVLEMSKVVLLVVWNVDTWKWDYKLILDRGLQMSPGGTRQILGGKPLTLLIYTHIPFFDIKLRLLRLQKELRAGLCIPTSLRPFVPLFSKLQWIPVLSCRCLILLDTGKCPFFQRTPYSVCSQTLKNRFAQKTFLNPPFVP